jgi:cytochrome c553
MRFRNQGMQGFPAMLVAMLLACVPAASYAEGGKVTANVAAGKQIFENGKEGISPCQSCHGPQALGIDAMGTPRLADLGYAYIVKQLTNFANDERTGQGVGAVMNLFAKQLTEEERRNVAAYVNTLEPAPELSNLVDLKAQGTEVGEAYRGQILVRYGVVGKAPACQSCHGFNGRGSDPVYPKIGQQKFVYLVNQLHSWKDGSRANDPLGQMRKVAAGLSDQDILDAATYLSHAPQSTIGDNFVPNNQSVLENINLVH